jgi:hypothetical protein
MVIVCNRSLFNKYGWMAFVCYFENSKGTSMSDDFISGVLFGITVVAGLAFIFGFVRAWWKDVKENHETR